MKIFCETLGAMAVAAAHSDPRHPHHAVDRGYLMNQSVELARAADVPLEVR